MALNFIPEVLKVGLYKGNSSKTIVSMRREGGSNLFSSQFYNATGYNPIDNPRDSIESFEREATGRVRIIENVPISGIKIANGLVFNKTQCINLIDPRNFTIPIPTWVFCRLLENGINCVDRILQGEFIYSVYYDEMYHIIPVNSEEYQKALWEKDVIKKRKESLKHKIKCVIGKVYILNIKSTGRKVRAIYLGKLPSIVGYSSIKYYRHRVYTGFDQPKHVFVTLVDSYIHTRRFYTINRFRNCDEIIIQPNSEGYIRRVQEPDMKLPLKSPDEIELMYFDDYINEKHNYEFNIHNIVTIGSIDPAIVLEESSIQTYDIVQKNRYTKEMIDLFLNQVKFVPWTLDELLTCVKAMSLDWYCYNSKDV